MKNMKALKYFLGAVLIIATVWSCTEEEFGSTYFVSTATAPSNITAFFNVTQDNTGTVTIIPNGEGAVSYEVYFGDNTAEPAKVLQGKSAAHVYAEGNYEVKIVAINITGLKTESVLPLVVSFKAPENLEVVITNDIAASKKVNVTASADFAILFDVYFGEAGNDEPVSANNGETASYVYQEAGTYTIRVVSKSAAIQTTEYIVDFEAIAILQPINSAPTPPTRADVDVISIYGDTYTNVAGTNFNPDWGQSGQGSGFAEFDLDGDKMLQYINLSYQGIGIGETIDVSGMEFLHMDVWTGGVTVLETSLINGVDGNSTEAPILRDLTADNWTSFDIPISEYTDQGLTVDQIFQLKLVGDPWAAGTVFVDNIYFYNSTPSAPTTAAPTPTANAADVVSIYSDAYTGVALSEVNPGWGQATTLEEVEVAGNKTWLYKKLDFTGIVTDYVNPTDLSGTTHVHFDYWTPDATSLGFKIVNTNMPDGATKESQVDLSSIKIGSWVSVDIPLSDYTTDLTGITQMLFASSGATIYIDNLYFYKKGSTGTTTGTAPYNPIDFEAGGFGADWTWTVFENDTNPAVEIVANPETTGINTSSTVAKITALTGGQPWVGSESLHGSDIGSFSFDSTNSIVKIMVYKTVISDVGLKFAEASGDAQPEVKVTNTLVNQWEELTFDLSGSIGQGATGIIDQIIIFPDFNLEGRTSDNVVYFDNITFGSN